MSEYRPGVCNIGPAEIALRRRSGHIGAAATVAVLSVLVATRAPRGLRLLLALPATMSASGYIQAGSHFCAGLGSRGVYNFGPVGQTHEVVDPESRALDAAASRRIGLQAAGIGVAVAAVALALPL